MRFENHLAQDCPSNHQTITQATH